MRSILALFLAVSAPAQLPAERFEFAEPQMGVEFKIVVYADRAEIAQQAAQAAMARVKQLNGLLSDYDSDSELSRLSRTAASGKAVEVSDPLWHVLREANRLSVRSDGAFDVTVGPVVKLWRRARRRQQMPDAARLATARQSVGYRFLRFDPQQQTVELTQPDMRLDLGGIAKGFAADEALRVLKAHGLSRALVDASGDLALGDSPPNAKGWKIGVAPLSPEDPPSEILALSNCAVATSGDAWQFVEIDGRRYSHIVDPRTGLGLTWRSSVTVVAPTCIAADSLASTVSVLGAERGIRLIEETPHAAALVVEQDDKGQIQTHVSPRMKQLLRDRKTNKDEASTP